MLIVKNKKSKHYKKLELHNSKKQHNKLVNSPIPDFNIGKEYISKLVGDGDITRFGKAWFNEPQNNFSKITSRSTPVSVGEFIEFKSLLGKDSLVRFKYDAAPANTPGSKVALIIVMHWNGKLVNYDRVTTFLRENLFPVSTLIHIPAGRGLNPGIDCLADYDSVSPNVGKTLFNLIEDIADIQFMANYLKQVMGYSEVGLFTYSIGSMKGFIASMMAPELFDFGVFHLIANDFDKAVMKGVATPMIASKIKGNIDKQLLHSLWSPISPGAYTKYFKHLPTKSRIVSCKYDYVFGPSNVSGMVKNLKKYRSDIEIASLPLSHTTLGSFPQGLESMKGDIEYMYANTLMSQYPRTKLFEAIDHPVIHSI